MHEFQVNCINFVKLFNYLLKYTGGVVSLTHLMLSQSLYKQLQRFVFSFNPFGFMKLLNWTWGFSILSECLCRDNIYRQNPDLNHVLLTQMNFFFLKDNVRCVRIWAGNSSGLKQQTEKYIKDFPAGLWSSADF